jgi:hypothetical protein
LLQPNGSLYIPERSRRLRWLALLDGLVMLMWLSRENNNVVTATVLGWALAILLLVFMVTGQLGGRLISVRRVVLGGVVLGAVAGLGSAITTTGLMLFKNALHAHVFLDYPVHVMVGILARTPIWTLAGALVGLGLVLAWLALRREEEQ